MSASDEVRDLLPSRIMAEVRRMRDRTWLAGREPMEGSLAVVSPRSGEGRTTLALALALVLSELDPSRPVLLVDCDTQRPTLHGRLGVSQEPGLGAVLRGAVPLDQAVQGTAITGLRVLTGDGDSEGHMSGLVVASALSELLREALQTHRAVLVDTPALSVSSCGLLVASQVDRSLLVVRANRTARRDAQSARDELQAVGARLLGVMLNDFQDFLPRWLKGR